MFPSTSATPEDIVQAEIFNILALLYSMNRKPFAGVFSSTRHDLLAEQIAIACMHDSTVLSLCRLADPRKDVWSFRQLHKERQNVSAAVNSVTIEERLSQYEVAIRPLQQHERHERIAHLSKTPGPSQDISLERLVNLTRLAVETFDEILGAKQSYRLKPGSQEQIIDLCKELYA